MQWTPELLKKFETLKRNLSTKPIQAYSWHEEQEAPFEVWPDWSNIAIGHLLQQQQDGQRRLIACGGRKNTPGESNYEPTKGEYAVIVDDLH